LFRSMKLRKQTSWSISFLSSIFMGWRFWWAHPLWPGRHKLWWAVFGLWISFLCFVNDMIDNIMTTYKCIITYALVFHIKSVIELIRIAPACNLYRSTFYNQQIAR
jgi:hypothetical protein